MTTHGLFKSGPEVYIFKQEFVPEQKRRTYWNGIESI